MLLRKGAGKAVVVVLRWPSLPLLIWLWGAGGDWSWGLLRVARSV